MRPATPSQTGNCNDLSDNPPGAIISALPSPNRYGAEQRSSFYRLCSCGDAASFLGYVVGKFPSRIHTIRTDNGPEFQVKFHWRILDLGMAHIYIKPRTPQLNGKVERSHSTDQQEFYQLLSYKDDVDPEAKLMEWETFYNCHRPHASLKGKTPYEILLEKLQSNQTSTEVISSATYRSGRPSGCRVSNSANCSRL
jgi:Integrase core domain